MRVCFRHQRSSKAAEATGSNERRTPRSQLKASFFMRAPQSATLRRVIKVGAKAHARRFEHRDKLGGLAVLQSFRVPNKKPSCTWSIPSANGPG
jgi:hypothetical protein